MEATLPKKSKPPRATPARRDLPATESGSTRVTYRELRNTPGRVWERLADNKVLTLVADGRARAIVIPVDDGDAQSALEAYRRGRAMMAVASMRRSARESGASALTLADVNAVIRQVRDERNRTDRKR